MGGICVVAGIFSGSQWDNRAAQFLIVSGMLGIFIGIMNIVTAKYKNLIWIDSIVAFILIFYLGFVLFS
jgi:hypothetical protein